MARRVTERFAQIWEFFGINKGVAALASLSAGTTTLIRKTQQANNQLSAPFKNAGSSMSQYASGLKQIGGALATVGAGGLALRQLTINVREFLRVGVEFNRILETGQLGIASIAIATRKYVDETGQGVAVQRSWLAANIDAAAQLQALRVAGLQTAATTRQLVGAFQEAVGVGSAYGLTLTQIRLLTISITKAAINLGLPLFQINQEIRALLSGDIDRNARVARALNITTQDVANATQAGKLFEFLAGKVQAFEFAGVKSLETFQVKLSNLQEAFEVFAGVAGSGLFTNLKKAIDVISQDLFNMNTAQVSKDFSGLVNSLRAILTLMGEGIVRSAGGLITTLRSLSSAIRDILPQIVVATQAFGGLLVAGVNLGKEMLSLAASMVTFGLKSGGVAGALQAATALTQGFANAIKGLREQAGIVGLAFKGLASVIIGSFLVRIAKFFFGPSSLLGTGILAVARAIGVVGVATRGAGQALIHFGLGISTMQAPVLRLGLSIHALGGAVTALGLALRAALPWIGAVVSAFLILRTINEANIARQQAQHEENLQQIRDNTAQKRTVAQLAEQYAGLLEALKDKNLSTATRRDLENQAISVSRELATTDKAYERVLFSSKVTLEALNAVRERSLLISATEAQHRLNVARAELADLEKQKAEALKAAGQAGRTGIGSRRLVSEIADSAALKNLAGMETKFGEASRAVDNQTKKVEELGLASKDAFHLFEALQLALASTSDIRPSETVEQFQSRIKAAFNDIKAGATEAERLQQDLTEAMMADNRRRLDAGLITLQQFFNEQESIIDSGGKQIIAIWHGVQNNPVFKQLIKFDPGAEHDIGLQLEQATRQMSRASTDLKDFVQKQGDEIGKAFIGALVEGIESGGNLETRLAIVEARIREKFQVLALALKQSKGPEMGAAILDAIISPVIAKERFAILKNEIDGLASKTRAAIDEIKNQQETGAISGVTSRRRIAKAYQAEADKLAALLVTLRRYASTSQDASGATAEALVDVENRYREVIRLAGQTNIALMDLAQAAREGFQRAFVDTILQIGQEIKTLEDFFRQFFETIARSVAETGLGLLAQEITDAAVSLFKSGGPSKTDALVLGIAGQEVQKGGAQVQSGGATLLGAAQILLVASLALKVGAAAASDAANKMIAANVAMAFLPTIIPPFASGGYVRGPGSSTSDSIHARLSHGEYVLNARAVRALGPELLDILNSINRPVVRRTGRTHRYAAGGLVSSVASGGSEDVLRVELAEGLVAREMSGSAGRRIIVQQVKDSRKLVREILGTNRKR